MFENERISAQLKDTKAIFLFQNAENFLVQLSQRKTFEGMCLFFEMSHTFYHA